MLTMRRFKRQKSIRFVSICSMGFLLSLVLISKYYLSSSRSIGKENLSDDYLQFYHQMINFVLSSNEKNFSRMNEEINLLRKSFFDEKLRQTFDDVENLRQNYLFRPRVRSERLKPLNKTFYSQLGQDEIVDRLLNEKTHGFYVEIGGYDGVSLSNTLFFEEERQWSGLLVEANPNLFLKLNSSGRNAFISNTCLSPNSSSMKLNFTFADYLTGLEQTDHKDQITGFGLIQCFPLPIYFFALNITQIDYFSLDVEGMEIEILQQIDFHLIRIDVLSIEYARKYHRSPESYQYLQSIREILLSTGLYHQVLTLQDLDVIFMRNPCQSQ